MSKPNNKPPLNKPKPFYSDKDVSLYVLQAGSRITGFRAIFQDKALVDVKVRRGKILEAFKKFENHTLIKNL